MFDDFFIRALFAGIGVAFVTGPLGCFVVWRRLSYFGDTLAHSALLGVTIAYSFELNIAVSVFLISSVIALILNGKQFFFKGVCKGYITKIPRGKDGFGYDPIFQPLKSKLTFAEMNQSEKGKISHRGIAVKKLIDYLNKQNN